MADPDDEYVRMARIEHIQRRHSESIAALWGFVLLLFVIAFFLMWGPK